MRLIVKVLLVTCASGSLLGAFAQDTTIRSGFAVVTVVSGNVAGLVATESLLNRTSQGVQKTIVAPSPLVPGSSLLVPLGAFTESTTAIALANPSGGAGGVNLILTDTRGEIVLNTTIQLGPFGHFSKFLNEFFTAPLATFSTPLLLTVSSEIPVAILALNFQSEDFTTIPFNSLSPPSVVPVQPLTALNAETLPGFGLGLPSTTPVSATPSTPSIGGAGSMVFAVVAIGGGWTTEIAIGNTSSATQIIRIDFFGRDGGNTDSLTDIIIPSRGVFFFSSESAGRL